MKCEQEEQCLLYLWGEMTPSDSQAFAQHLDKCPVCKGRVARLEPLVRSMQSIGYEELPLELAQRIKTSLTGASEAQPVSLWFMPRRVLAVAASILLIVGVGVFWKAMLNRTQQLPGAADDYVRLKKTEPLTEDDYVEALALVWISEPEQANGTPTDSDDILVTEIRGVAAQIESLLQEVEYEPDSDKSNSVPDDVQGSRLPTSGRTIVT